MHISANHRSVKAEWMMTKNQRAVVVEHSAKFIPLNRVKTGKACIILTSYQTKWCNYYTTKRKNTRQNSPIGYTVKTSLKSVANDTTRAFLPLKRCRISVILKTSVKPNTG